MRAFMLATKLTWIFSVSALLLAGLVVLGEGHFASSSPPPLATQSGLLLRPASPEQVKALSTGLKPSLIIEDSYATRSTRHRQAWYVGARIKGPKHGERVGVWLLTGPKTRPELLYSVDRVARAASVWPGGERQRAGTSAADQEAIALISALRPR